jgi:hypothetical protein
MQRLLNYYDGNIPTPTYDELQNLLIITMKSEHKINWVDLKLDKLRDILKNRILDLFCKFIDSDLLDIQDFEYFAMTIINHINIVNKNNNHNFEYLNHFMEYISKLYCGKCHGKCRDNNKSTCKIKYKECLSKILNSKVEVSLVFMLSLPIYYEKYIEKKYAPDPPGPGFKKTENHFNILVNEQEINKK